MSEQVTLQQIAELIDRKFVEFKASQDERFDAIDAKFAQQDARFDASDVKFGTIDAKLAQHDRRFDAIDAKFDMIGAKLAKQDARHEQVVETLSEMVRTVGEQFAQFEKRLDQFAADIIRENRVSAEQLEGRKIASLAEESQAHKATLVGHENRIGYLEEVAG